MISYTDDSPGNQSTTARDGRLGWTTEPKAPAGFHACVFRSEVAVIFATGETCAEPASFSKEPLPFTTGDSLGTVMPAPIGVHLQ